MAKEIWYLREAQIEQLNELRRENIRPTVSIALKNSPAYYSFINIEISNLGKGAAKDIKFDFFDKSGDQIYKGDVPVVDEFYKLHILENGIHTIGIGQKIESFVFSFTEISGKLGGADIFSPFFILQVKYEDVEGTKYQNELVVDFSEYKGISEMGGGDPLHRMDGDVEKMRKVFDKLFSSNSNGINVNTYSSDDRAKEFQERRNRRNQSDINLSK